MLPPNRRFLGLYLLLRPGKAFRRRHEGCLDGFIQRRRAGKGMLFPPQPRYPRVPGTRHENAPVAAKSSSVLAWPRSRTQSWPRPPCGRETARRSTAQLGRGPSRPRAAHSANSWSGGTTSAAPGPSPSSRLSSLAAFSCLHPLRSSAPLSPPSLAIFTREQLDWDFPETSHRNSPGASVAAANFSPRRPRLCLLSRPRGAPAGWSR